MDIYRAVDQRASVRAFTDREVDHSVIDRVLRAASRAPSGGNLTHPMRRSIRSIRTR